MTSKPAYPVNGSKGLTKREYFAAHAPIDIGDAQDSLRQEPDGIHASYDKVIERLAALRYLYADKMVEAGQ